MPAAPGAGAGDDARIRYGQFAAELGVLFQIVDDILDVTGTDAALGKPSGSDERHGKRTYVSEHGLERARELASRSHASARAALAAARAGGRRRARADHRFRLHANVMSEDTPERLLDKVEGPADLHGLNDLQLAQIAQEVREHIIDTVGEIGGHFGANLGTCELAVALHSLLDSPRDKIIWDVGHQAYPHKVLTGRRERLSTIRQYGGLAPFCSIAESEHDIIGAGHASTSIGYAVGIKEAMRAGLCEDGPRRRRDRRRGDDRRRRLRGDLSGRRARHADRRRAQRQRDVDRTERGRDLALPEPRAPEPEAVARARGRRGWPDKLPGRNRREVRALGPQFKESIKAFWAPGLWWEELDWAYTGVIDGHDVRALRIAVREALAAERPVVVHIATVKGKGFAPAEDGGLEGMEKWHAAKPLSITNGKVTPPVPPNGAPKAPPQYTQVFGEALLAECRRDERVIGITAAMNTGTGLNILQQAMPDRYFDVGIAEQQAILFACGLALQGARPVAAIYSTFLQRAYDQIVHDACLQKLPVVFAMDRGGLVGDDGPTHHGAFDIAYLRCLPNIVLMAPRDEAMLVHMLHTAIVHV
jgi:1-deoxy-D-xylulose-5-phosphate synthase